MFAIILTYLLSTLTYSSKVLDLGRLLNQQRYRKTQALQQNGLTTSLGKVGRPRKGWT